MKQGTKALQDAGITYDKIEQAFVGYVYGWFNIQMQFKIKNSI